MNRPARKLGSDETKGFVAITAINLGVIALSLIITEADVMWMVLASVGVALSDAVAIGILYFYKPGRGWVKSASITAIVTFVILSGTCAVAINQALT